MTKTDYGLETKFMSGQVNDISTEGCSISGYASIFGLPDQSKDIVEKGAFSVGLSRLEGRGSKVKMLWQHDPSQPIGVWDEIYEDGHGLYVSGHILEDIPQGAQALSLIKAGAIDGLSIGYKTLVSQKDKLGRRHLTSVELWEVSLVTFPMLQDAKVSFSEMKSEQNVMAGLINNIRDLRLKISKSQY